MNNEEREQFLAQLRESCIRIVQPHGFMPNTKVENVISRADKLFKYILSGEMPAVSLEKWSIDPARELYGHDESTGEPIYADDDFHQDADGILTLTKNMPKMGYANPN